MSGVLVKSLLHVVVVVSAVFVKFIFDEALVKSEVVKFVMIVIEALDVINDVVVSS